LVIERAQVSTSRQTLDLQTDPMAAIDAAFLGALPRPEVRAAKAASVHDEEPMPQSAPPPPETIPVRTRRVSCDGVGGALGHPRVWLEMGDAGFVECGYCDRRFVLAKADEIPESELLTPGVYEGPGGH
jgi:uncharacterized Zn-finger protein